MKVKEGGLRAAAAHGPFRRHEVHASCRAIDQGTTSSRCMLFDAAARSSSVAQKEHRQIYPRPAGWSTTRSRSGPTCAK
ncbi:MAG: hypothetical protein WDM85_08820 [Caulobacteraceae bacterium]